jgi:zona occludens toxin
MLILITAAPGSFKSAMGATKAKQYAKEGRRVYHNINGLNGDNLFPLPDKDDWTVTEDGSVVIYDEAQMFDWLQYKGREKLSSDHRVKNLETHRHSGHDIILITQNPSFIHNHVLSLVGEHHHLHRAYGRGFADVFLWRYVSHTPNSSAAKNKAESHHKFKPHKSIFDEYKSTTIDTHKLKIPPIFFKLGGFLLVVILIIGYMVFGSDNPFLSASKIKDNIEASSGKPQTTVVDSQASSVLTDKTDLSLECRKGINVEKPECVKWFDDLSKNGGSIQTKSESNAFTISYNPNKPYDVDLSNVPLQVVDYPRLTGCIKKPTGDIVGIDQQGNIMPNLDKQACQKWLKGERLFDYTKQKNESQNVQVSNQANNPQPNQPTVQQMAQIEQAKNEGLI